MVIVKGGKCFQSGFLCTVLAKNNIAIIRLKNPAMAKALWRVLSRLDDVEAGGPS